MEGLDDGRCRGEGKRTSFGGLGGLRQGWGLAVAELAPGLGFGCRWAVILRVPVEATLQISLGSGWRVEESALGEKHTLV